MTRILELHHVANIGVVDIKSIQSDNYKYEELVAFKL